MFDMHAYLQKIRQIMAERENGIAIQGVSDNPPYAYSVGLLTRHGFEIIVFMLELRTASDLLNAIADSLDQGVKITPDVPMPDNKWIQRWPVLFKRCEPHLLDGRVNVASAIHGGKDFPVYQLVLPDAQGRFPGDAGYDLQGQPLLFNPPPSDDVRVLPMWTVYDRPSDQPAHWVARRWEVGPAGAVATNAMLKADTLEALRALLPPGLHCMPRQEGDDAAIVETWL